MEEVMAAVPDALLLAARALRDALIGFEPALVSGRDCAQVVEELARTEKACAAARARAAAQAVDDCPATKAALLAGELSLVQADEIARTEREVPGSEAGLVALAQ